MTLRRLFRRGLLPFGFCALSAIVLPAGAQHGAVDLEQRDPKDVEAERIEKDIAALAGYHGQGKKAAERLAAQGDRILPELHAALASPDGEAGQKIQLATVIAQIGDRSSIQPLIDAAAAHAGHDGIVQAVFDALAELPAAAPAVGFADAVLGDGERSWRVRRKALAYLGRQRVEAGRRWVERYRDDSQIELRAGALYLAARLGDASALAPMVEMLALPAPPSLRYALMLGIAELVGPQRFRDSTPEWIRESWEYESALRYAEFRTVSDERRSEMALEMIASKALFERQLAAEFILESAGPEELARLSGQEIPPHVRAVARHELRRAGFRLQYDERGKARAVRKEEP